MNILLFWQQPGPPAEGGGLSTLLFFGAFLLIFYFFFIKPSQKSKKEGTKFLETLKKGQKVVTIGGLYGTITRVEPIEVELLIAPKTYITVRRDCISREYSAASEALSQNDSQEEKKDNATKTTEDTKEVQL